MIEFKRGDLFRLDVQALVNPVNCVGIMGTGLALEFKKKFPLSLPPYERLCLDKQLKLNSVEIIPSGVEKPEHIILFPTRDNWRENSLYVPIRAGLVDMVKKCKEMGIESVGIPALGCGEGGLEWKVVRSIMVRELSGDHKIRFYVTEPIHKTKV